MSFFVEIRDILIEVNIAEDELRFDIVEDHIEVHLTEDLLYVELISDSINVDLVEDVIEVSLDDSCVCLPGGSADNSDIAVYDSDGTLSVGDFVYFSNIFDRYVLKALDNDTPSPVEGVVEKLISQSVVIVRHCGAVTLDDITLLTGKKVFVGPNGDPTSELPLTDYIQVLGVASSHNQLYLKPNLIRCRRLEL
jgi:hypothetical protein